MNSPILKTILVGAIFLAVSVEMLRWIMFIPFFRVLIGVVIGFTLSELLKSKS